MGTTKGSHLRAFLDLQGSVFSIFHQAGSGDTLHLAGGEAEALHLLEVTRNIQWIQEMFYSFINVKILSYRLDLN